MCNRRGAQCAPAVRMKPVHRRNDRIPLTIPWAHNVRPYGYNGTNNLQTAGGGYPVLRILYKMVSVVVCDMVFVRSGAPRLYPGAPSLALRAIHLVPRLRKVAGMCSSNIAEMRICGYHAVVKILCRSPFFAAVSSLPLPPCPQRKGRSSKRKGNHRCPFLFVPAPDGATLPTFSLVQCRKMRYTYFI